MQPTKVCRINKLHVVERLSAVSPAPESKVASPNPLDAYELLQIVGKGAFGKVFKAVDKNGRVVAVKYIKFEGEEEGIPSSALR